jgi:hypothetical protein
MKLLSLIFGVFAAVFGLGAAFFAYKASTMPVERTWDRDPSLRPRNIQEEAWKLTHSIEAMLFWAGRSSKRAAWLAALAGLCALLSATFGFLG